jgi:nitrite reductase/ring-hydroxylating ferredoxin subunit/uncharacterized membrane protein
LAPRATTHDTEQDASEEARMPTTTAAPVSDVVERLENASPLDPVVKAVRSAVSAVIRPQAVRDALHGVWLGHPLHPVLTDVPIGMWSAAAVLDAVPGTGPASTILIATGCAAALPTAVTGWTDWSDLHPGHQRVGLVHAAANVAALGLYTASVAARLRGRTARGKLLGWAGLGMMTAGGYLGGHLSFRQAAGANHGADIIDLFPSGWQGLGGLDDLPEGEPTKRTIGGVDLLVMRRGRHVDVISNKCSHLSGPLSDGEFTVEAGQGCIVCPWHGSTFRLADGGVVHGPATSPQQRFEARVTGDMVEVRLPGSD